MKLPLEIRRIVYEDALCPGIVYVQPENICSGDYLHMRDNALSAYLDKDKDREAMPGSAHDEQKTRRLRYIEWECVKDGNQNINYALLRAVSKVVQTEATTVFYGPRNHFVLPCGTYDFPRTSGHAYSGVDEVPDLPPFRSMLVFPWFRLSEEIRGK